METERNINENNALSAADALALTQSGREAAARRISRPWTWDLAISLVIGGYLAVIAYATTPWDTWAIAAFMFLFLGLQRAQENRSGIKHEGGNKRTFDPMRLIIGGAVLVIFTGGMLVGAKQWEWFPIVAAVFATVVNYVGYRWVNRRAVERARGERA